MATNYTLQFSREVMGMEFKRDRWSEMSKLANLSSLLRSAIYKIQKPEWRWLNHETPGLQAKVDRLENKILAMWEHAAVHGWWW